MTNGQGASCRLCLGGAPGWQQLRTADPRAGGRGLQQLIEQEVAVVLGVDRQERTD